MKTYIPNPLDTEHIVLPEALNELTEQMARNVHEVWAKGRIDEGWSYGEQRDDQQKKHPCLVAYEELPKLNVNTTGIPLSRPLNSFLNSDLKSASIL